MSTIRSYISMNESKIYKENSKYHKICMYVYRYTYIHTYMHTCIHTYIHTHVIHASYIHTYINIYTWHYVSIYAYVGIYIYRHTYIYYIYTRRLDFVIRLIISSKYETKNDVTDRCNIIPLHKWFFTFLC